MRPFWRGKVYLSSIFWQPADLATSKGDARRSIQGGGVYLNNRRVGDPSQMVSMAETIEGRFLVLRKGRRRYHLLRVK